MIRTYSELTEQEQSELSCAWVDIYKALEVYERITGASGLDDVVSEALRQEIEYQQNEEES